MAPVAVERVVAGQRFAGPAITEDLGGLDDHHLAVEFREHLVDVRIALQVVLIGRIRPVFPDLDVFRKMRNEELVSGTGATMTTLLPCRLARVRRSPRLNTRLFSSGDRSVD